MDGARRLFSLLLLLSAKHWAGGRRMHSEAVTAIPQSVYAYAWKRPVAHEVPHPKGNSERESAQPRGHQAASWKAYLVSRDFQNLASDLAEAIFSAPSGPLPDAERPSCLIGTGSLAQTPSAKLLEPVLEGEHGARPANAGELELLDLAIAA
jgi:hypothetical protein